MDLFSKCKALYEKIRYFEYGIPVDGVIKPVPSAEYYVKNYHFLKPEEFEKYGGGICWDYVEYERKFLEVNDIDFNQYYIITNTPPNYDTHTFITVKDGDDLIYIESSFKRVEHIIDGVQKFKTLEDIVKLITTNMWYCNDNDKHFDEFKYDVCKFKGHPQYGCTCEEYMKWMDDNSDIVIQDVSINPKKINEDELTVESCNFFQEGLFNFGKPKEPVDVMTKLSETFGELSEAQKEIINRPTNDRNPIGKFDFFVTPYSKYYYDMTIRVRKLDSFLKKESVLIGSVIGVPEGSVPVAMIDIIPDIDNVIKNYEAYEDGQLEYDDYYEQYIDDPRYGLGKVRVYADQNGAIYTCLSQDGKYTQVAKSYDEFVSKFNTYKFKLNKNEFTVSRRYSSRTGIDVFSNGLNTGDAEFTTTYKIDSDDIHTVALLYARFISFGVTQIFNMDADGDDEPDDFPVEYESLKQIVTACAEHGVDKPFYPKMKVVELTFHKSPEPTVSYFVPSKLTYVFALNESLDKPFMTVEVESGKVISVKFNDSTIKEYADPEEYDETLHDHIADEDDVYNESWTDFKNGVHPSSNLMFHVSLKNDMDGKTITPQLPSYITDGGELDDNYQEDTKTKRLCVSPSIEGCLIAILNYKKIREHVGDKFYVYTPEKPFSQYKHKTNKEIVKDKLVFDANITKEAWILEPCKLKLYGIIKLKKVKDLKKKPTVEKGIKMNTIKLDYEWIMTPKASGKFNKAIGDSPDEEDTKEKPTKEAFELSTDEEIFTEAKSFKQTIREEQTKNTRVSNVNSESKFKAIFKDYLSNIDVPSSDKTIQFKNPVKIDKNVISSKKFDIDTYRSAFTHLKSLYNKLLSAIKNNDLVHSKSYRNKIGDLIGRSIENNIIFIDINEGNIEINIGAKTFRKLDSSKYDLFVHRSNNPNLSSIKPTIGTANGTGIFMYKSSVVYMFAFEKTSDINKRKKQFEIFDHYISSSYGDNLYLYKPTSSNVFCIDDNLMKRPGLPFNASMIPVNIETKNPLPVTKISESDLKKLLNIDDESEEKPINEYAVPGSFYHDIKPHPGGVYALVEDDSYRSHFCHIDFQGHDNKYLGWNAPTGSELILKTQEVIKSEKWEFRKSETDTVIPEYTHIFTYAQQILPIIRLDKIKDRLNELLAPHCPLTVHDPNSDTDIEYVCIQPQQYEVIDKKQTSYVYDTAYKHMFENHIVYLPIVDDLGMFEVKHTTHVAGTYDDNLFFEELFYGPTISYKLFDAFKDLNSVTLYDISDINAWDFACGYEDHYDEDGERIEPGDPKHPSNKQVNESTNILVSNEEFFMEASKNPDVKARKRTVKNLRKLGVDRAHEVDSKKKIKDIYRQINELKSKCFTTHEISKDEYYARRAPLDKQLEQLEKLKKGIDVDITDSYGNKHKIKLTSKDDNDYGDSYDNVKNVINITPKTISSNKFDATFNHEAGHSEQRKRFGRTNKTDYTISNIDDYPIKCAKLFLQKNKDKMNSHDILWTELHADFLSCKKVGFGKMMKLIASFKKDKKYIDNAIENCVKDNKETCEKLKNKYLKYTDEEGNAHTASQEDVDQCISLYYQTKEKLDHYEKTLRKRSYDLEDKTFEDNLSEDYKNKLKKVLDKVIAKKYEIRDKILNFSEIYKHKGISLGNAKAFNAEMSEELDTFNYLLKDLKAYYTTYDYRIKFMEDMMNIHNGHPGRCSMKYPPMTPEDKKYMQEADCILDSNDEFFNLIE